LKQPDHNRHTNPEARKPRKRTAQNTRRLRERSSAGPMLQTRIIWECGGSPPPFLSRSLLRRVPAPQRDPSSPCTRFELSICFSQNGNARPPSNLLITRSCLWYYGYYDMLSFAHATGPNVTPGATPASHRRRPSSLPICTPQKPPILHVQTYLIDAPAIRNRANFQKTNAGHVF